MPPDAPLVLTTPQGAPFRFEVEVTPADPPRLKITGLAPPAPGRTYALADWEQPSWVEAYRRIAADFGTRAPDPGNDDAPSAQPPLTPLLTANLTPDILYGYGDPCVVRTDEGAAYHLIVTSNDAPAAFPILRSDDLATWTPTGFAFPPGRKPAWTADGPEVSDFWAPELHRVGEAYWLCFCARRPDGTLAIGIARSSSPEGPFETPREPLIGGGVIDAHLLVEEDDVHLFWKADNNGVWPALLADLLHERPDLIAALFPAEADQKSAALIATLEPWTERLDPMRRFIVHGPLIEAVAEDLAGFAARLRARGGGAGAVPEAILSSLHTPVYAQKVSADGRRLLGEPALVLQNDQPWEAHLIEGGWIWREGGRYYFFYSGNDFATGRYGIGVAVADRPLGPYRKSPAPLLRSTPDWIGPGHPSVARAPDGRAHLFLHAYPPGRIGYKAFRALLSVPLAFDGDRVMLG